MTYKRGRLVDHIHLRTRDTDATFAFYRATLAVLGVECTVTETYLSADELWIDAGQGTHVHLAFQAPDRETVGRWYEAGLANGGTDNGPPGERHYHPGYYAAFLLDPDGNNVEAVFHGPNTRSAPAVEVTPGDE
ncbi:VOC family protein [Tsuneonella sp. HG222]